MINLSVNVNKIATLRNSRGGSVPSVIAAVDTCLEAGAAGITVHPRADERHIRRNDVLDIAVRLAARRSGRGRTAEFNIEGDPRPDLIDLALEVGPTQVTLVPVVAGEITSHVGYGPTSDARQVSRVVARLRDAGIRVSLFVAPDEEAVRWAADQGPHRIELYTEPFARACVEGAASARTSFDRYVAAADLAHSQGLGVNAGHDLDLENLVLFRTLPHLEEVSIGHALVSRAVWVGLERVVREYLQVLSDAPGPRDALAPGVTARSANG